MIAAMTDTSAPVRITIGRKFDDHYIMIHEAPASVVSRVVGECTLVSVTPEGLYIPTENVL
jgi:hypothetical protein